ncbi:MAG: DUF3192 domain-containing protein [Pseudomonadota bacterium]
MRTQYRSKALNVIAAALVATSLSGCLYINGEGASILDESWEREQKENRKAIAGLDIGMQRSEITSELGAPAFSEAFTRAEDEYRVLFYRTQRRHGDGDTTKDETTPLVFKNDLLLGWGDSVYDSLR